MKGDIPLAAIRLAAQSTVRTHERIFHNHVQGSKAVPQVVVNGITYRSRLEVRRTFHIGAQTLNDWIAKGKARIL